MAWGLPHRGHSAGMGLAVGSPHTFFYPPEYVYPLHIPSSLPTDGPEAGAPAAAVPHPQDAVPTGPPGTPRQGLQHLSRLQEHLQRAGRQRLPGQGGEQPQTCCGGLPRAVSSPVFLLQPLCHPTCRCVPFLTRWHSGHAGEVIMPLGFPSCGAADRPDRPAEHLVLKGASAPLAQSVEVSLVRLHHCRCRYTL